MADGFVKFRLKTDFNTLTFEEIAQRLRVRLGRDSIFQKGNQDVGRPCDEFEFTVRSDMEDIQELAKIFADPVS